MSSVLYSILKSPVNLKGGFSFRFSKSFNIIGSFETPFAFHTSLVILSFLIVVNLNTEEQNTHENYLYSVGLSKISVHFPCELFHNLYQTVHGINGR